ncbi:EpsG family protein [Lederbergia wuyishanensis]|uniref:Transmembrane protein EpsG n=1 Tax=Lederbergia wuyishanensis TaxID=1347903 RepID=A0ABU0D7Q5_9BACI|nr:EpsG family protein [Lederbergia wuyishanensis]MCJ8009120.1 EpsG family protein [Lederbergia wuyishanensis]MDQ0344459.1 transmembrane protein EpsG [Lederbergia wuyishanensis]
MTILWFNLAIVYICAFFARYSSTPSLSTGAIVQSKPNKILVFCTMIVLVLVSGLRSNIGDTYFYKHAFKINDFSWSDWKNQENIGFWLFQKFLKNFSDDPQILIFTAALITNILIILVLYKYSKMIELSIYVYICGGLYLVSMNGIRQVMTATILFTATKFLIEGNWIKYILIVLFASLFHESALILIPIYFIVRYRAWSKTTMILLSSSIIIVIGYEYFSSFLFAAIEKTQYGHYSDFDEGGANIVRVAVHGVPLFIAYLGREKLRTIFPSSDYIVNMALIGFMFMIISTQNWIFARFSIYFTLYQLILISWIVLLFRKQDQRLIYFALVICYLLYFFYENVMTLNIVYRSNYFGS